MAGLFLFQGQVIFPSRTESGRFQSGLSQRYATALPGERTEKIWREAGEEFGRICSSQPEEEKHKRAMVLPAVALDGWGHSLLPVS